MEFKLQRDRDQDRVLDNEKDRHVSMVVVQRIECARDRSGG